LKCSLLAGLIVGVLYLPHLHRRVDEEIRRSIESRLARHYAQHQPGLQVSVRSAELVRGKGILVRGLKVRDGGIEGPARELLDLDEVFLACSTEIDQLLKGEPEVAEVVLRRPTLRVARRADGSWSAARLLPLPRSGRRSPEVRVEAGTIEIADPPRAVLTLRDVACTLAPAPEPPSADPRAADPGTRGDAREPDASQPVAGEPDAAPTRSNPHLRKFSATFVADKLGQVQVSGMVDPHRPEWSLGGSVEGLDVSPELCEALPVELGSRLACLGSLRGQGKLDFQASYDPDAESPYQFQVAGKLTQARLDDPRLPYWLTDIRADFACDNRGWEIRDLFARSGQSELQLSCRREGWGGKSPLQLKARLRDLDLDPKYVDLLPEALQKQWYRYLPSGRIHADVDLSSDGDNWYPDVTIQCLSVAFSYEKFPYRLEDSRGTIELSNDVLRAHLTGYTGSQPIRLDAEVHRPFSGSYGWLKARGDNIPLDEKLMAALPKPTRTVVRSLEPQGTFNFSGQLWRDQPAEPVHRHLVAELNRCSMRYERFPYPIGNVRGTLEMLDDQWTFRDLTGTNDTGQLTCEGSLVPTAQGNRLSLRLTGTNVPLEEELRGALSPAVGRAWNDFKLQGRVDLEEARIDFVPGQDRFDVELRIRPRSEYASISPVYFPFRLEKLRGLLWYRNGEVTLEEFYGEHGNARVSASGKGTFQPDGSWRLEFDGLRADRLRMDREFVQALPERLKKAVAELNPDGPFYLGGALTLARGGQPDDPITSAWDLEIGFDRASIDFGVRLENMYGTLRLVGGHDGQHLAARGQLNVESVSYKDFQLTRVTGPVWIDDRQVLFGSWVDRPTPWRQVANLPHATAAGSGSGRLSPAPRAISGQLFGGTVVADGWVALGATPRFGLDATLSHGDLARLAQEVLPGRQDLQGDILASVELRGTGRSLNLLSGRGKIQTRRANVYELPLMAALVKLVRVRKPDKSAFGNSDIDFRIEGTHIYLDRITFSGDPINLAGNGEMSFQGDIRLTLHTMVGRPDPAFPVVQQILGGASQQILLVHVGGTLQNPETSKQALPGLNQALQQLQGEAAGTNGPSDLLAPLRPWPAETQRRLPKRQ
jgi:hypothetical protein